MQPDFRIRGDPGIEIIAEVFTPKALQTLAGGRRRRTTGWLVKSDLHPEGMPDESQWTRFPALATVWHPFGMLAVSS
jgi:hypothetical protein